MDELGFRDKWLACTKTNTIGTNWWDVHPSQKRKGAEWGKAIANSHTRHHSLLPQNKSSLSVTFHRFGSGSAVLYGTIGLRIRNWVLLYPSVDFKMLTKKRFSKSFFLLIFLNVRVNFDGRTRIRILTNNYGSGTGGPKTYPTHSESCPEQI